MACGCKDGKTTYSVPVKSGGGGDNGNGIPTPPGTTRIRFDGVSAPRTYRGPTGREYRFGSDKGHSEHFVDNRDVSIFVSPIGAPVRAGFSMVVNGGAGVDGGEHPLLDAKGPPDREAALVLTH
jgi:hypothetical protein